MSATAVLVNYKRTENLKKIIDSLSKQTLKPQIWVWNNGPEPFYHEKADWIINSSKNILLSIPLLYQCVETDIVWRMDDDVIPKDKHLMEDVYKYMSTIDEHDRILGTNGVRLLDGRSYKKSEHIMGATKDCYVDIVKGNMYWVTKKAAKSFDAKKCDTHHMDLNISFQLAKTRRNHHVLAGFLKDRIDKLPELYDDKSGAGYCTHAGHYTVRNRLCQRWLKSFESTTFRPIHAAH